MYALQEMDLAEMLTAMPELAGVFVARKMACVGCPLARFCRLTDAASAYLIDPNELLADLQTRMQAPKE